MKLKRSLVKAQEKNVSERSQPRWGSLLPSAAAVMRRSWLRSHDARLEGTIPSAAFRTSPHPSGQVLGPHDQDGGQDVLHRQRHGCAGPLMHGAPACCMEWCSAALVQCCPHPSRAAIPAGIRAEAWPFASHLSASLPSTACSRGRQEAGAEAVDEGAQQQPGPRGQRHVVGAAVPRTLSRSHGQRSCGSSWRSRVWMSRVMLMPTATRAAGPVAVEWRPAHLAACPVRQR